MLKIIITIILILSILNLLWDIWCFLLQTRSEEPEKLAFQKITIFIDLLIIPICIVLLIIL